MRPPWRQRLAGLRRLRALVGQQRVAVALTAIGLLLLALSAVMGSLTPASRSAARAKSHPIAPPAHTARLPTDVRGCHIAPLSSCPGARLHSVNLSFAQLPHANLRKSNLASTSLAYANLSGADLLSANLQGSDLSGANLDRTNLANVNFSGGTLTNALLIGANLKNARLVHADLSLADFAGANLKGTSLVGAVFCHTTMPDGVIRNPSCH